jgi:hypothetical protein
VSVRQDLDALREGTDEILATMRASAAKRREEEARQQRGLNLQSLQPVGRLALPLTLAHVFRRHLIRHPDEKWRLDGREVRLGCSCGAQLRLAIGAHGCETEGCDRVWFWTGRGVFHAHPDQTSAEAA